MSFFVCSEQSNFLPASLIMVSSSEYVCSGGKETTPAASAGTGVVDKLLNPACHVFHGRKICLQH